MQRAELIKEFTKTKDLSRKTTSGSFKQTQKWHIYDDIPPFEELDLDDVSVTYPAVVDVVNADTLTTALEVVKEGLSPLVLNMASDFCPGGGVAKGCRAQEEELFRRSNYHQCTNRKFYPIKDDEFITTDKVLVLKDENYNVLHDYVEVDFIAVAAVRKPHTDGTEYYNDAEEELMKAKIDAIFRYGVYQEKDSLVLGALGCGAFYNPPEAVRDLFQESLKRYGKYFKKVVFAVLSEGRNPNYEVFKTLAT